MDFLLNSFPQHTPQRMESLNERGWQESIALATRLVLVVAIAQIEEGGTRTRFWKDPARRRFVLSIYEEMEVAKTYRILLLYSQTASTANVILQLR